MAVVETTSGFLALERDVTLTVVGMLGLTSRRGARGVDTVSSPTLDLASVLEGPGAVILTGLAVV
jgi:hypothetical protein